MRAADFAELLGIEFAQAMGQIGCFEIKNLPHEPAFTLGEEPIVDATIRALEARAFSGQVLVVSFNPAIFKVGTPRTAIPTAQRPRCQQLQ